MLRTLSLAALLAFAAPAVADEINQEATVAQQKEQQPAQQAPKRDCERSRGEGVS